MNVLLKSDRWEGFAAFCTAVIFPVVSLLYMGQGWSLLTVLSLLLWIVAVIVTPALGLSAIRRGTFLNQVLGWVALALYASFLFVWYRLVFQRG